jgi:dTDP-4-amino-4,6-dideoxygalactose transaminase
VPLLDLAEQHKQIRDEVLSELIRVVDSQKFILGEDVQKLESEIASYCSATYAVGCGSGSDALILALMALGIGPGDEVLTSPYTFFATAGSISLVGATPVFADIDESTFNIDPSQVSHILSRRPRIRAIIPVHLFGGCADMDAISALAARHGVSIIEDAAQSIGSEYRGRRAGSIGQIGCFSFYPTKNLGGYGEGGMLTTNDADLAARLRSLRVHGSVQKYHHDRIGLNSRLDTLQASVLRVKLRYLEQWSAGRQRNADLYRLEFAKRSLPVIAPIPAPYQNRHIYNQFVIRAPQRDALQAFLKEHGVGTDIYYPIPLHLQPCYAHLGYEYGHFPVSERIAADSLALPVYSEFPEEDLRYVCGMMQAFYRQHS